MCHSLVYLSSISLECCSHNVSVFIYFTCITVGHNGRSDRSVCSRVTQMCSNMVCAAHTVVRFGLHTQILVDGLIDVINSCDWYNHSAKNAWTGTLLHFLTILLWQMSRFVSCSINSTSEMINKGLTEKMSGLMLAVSSFLHPYNHQNHSIQRT